MDPERSSADSSPKQPPRFPWGTVAVLVALMGWLMLSGYVVFPLLVLGGLALFLSGVFYLYVPLGLRRTFWQSPRPAIRAIEPGAVDWPGLAEAYAAATTAFARLGFVDRGGFLAEEVNSSGGAFVAIYEDRAGRTLAKWFQALTPKKAVGPVVGFTTRFVDGSEYVTSNNPLSGLYPVPGFRKGLAFPGVDDPARLLALHRRGLAEAGEFSSRLEATGGDPLADLRDLMAREQAQQVASGYSRLDEASGLYRLTLKGAYLIAVKQLWPWGPIRRAIRRRRVARKLREWESTPA